MSSTIFFVQFREFGTGDNRFGYCVTFSAILQIDFLFRFLPKVRML